MPDAEEIARREQAIQQLIQKDAELGAIAQSRVTAKYGTSSSLDGYDFSDSFDKSEQATRSIDWVHQPWLRPIRFVYRNSPKSLRFIVKRLARK